jgi:putative phosphoribosyl transferase
MFRDRIHAGEILADLLRPYIKRDPYFFVIPNGGVPVAIPIIKLFYELNSKVDFQLLPVKKIHLPQRSSGFGAITIDGEVLLNGPLITRMKLPPAEIQSLTESTLKEINQRKLDYAIEPLSDDLTKKVVVIVDEGLPTGITMMAAIKSLQKFHPFELIVAVPTASQLAIDRISPYVNTIICPNIRRTFFFSTAHSYRSYQEVGVEEVKLLLKSIPLAA